MKKSQGGFIVPIILILVTLVVGGGIYWSTQNNVDIQSTDSIQEVDQTTDQTNSQNQSIKNQTTDKKDNVQTKISITSISPTSGPIGTKITIEGSGFTSTGNTAHFGLATYNFDAMGTTYPNISSSNNVMVFQVPAEDNPMCPELFPRCPIRTADPITPGTYNLSVSNINGRSNVLVFKVQ